MAQTDMLFHETQRFRQPWLIAIIIASALPTVGLFGYAMVSQFIFNKPFGDGAIPDMALLLLGLACALPMLGVIWLFVVANLQTTVGPDGLYIRFYPFHLSQRKIPLEKVVSFRALTYRPIREYGGWGLRFAKRGRAYNVSGRESVRLEFSDGKHLLIGSQRSKELAAAIQTWWQK